MTLDRYQGSTLDLASSWVTLHPDERRRRAITAARDHDLTTL